MRNYVEALLAEREVYVRRGLKDRVAMVDAALESVGYIKDQPVLEVAAVEPVSERATRKAAQKRRI